MPFSTDLPTGTEERGAGGELLAQPEQVRLIATRAMQQEQREGGIGLLRRHEPMDEPE